MGSFRAEPKEVKKNNNINDRQQQTERQHLVQEKYMRWTTIDFKRIGQMKSSSFPLEPNIFIFIFIVIDSTSLISSHTLLFKVRTRVFFWVGGHMMIICVAWTLVFWHACHICFQNIVPTCFSIVIKLLFYRKHLYFCIVFFNTQSLYLFIFCDSVLCIIPLA